jgi:hypothetical protein
MSNGEKVMSGITTTTSALETKLLAINLQSDMHERIQVSGLDVDDELELREWRMGAGSTGHERSSGLST